MDLRMLLEVLVMPFLLYSKELDKQYSQYSKVSVLLSSPLVALLNLYLKALVTRLSHLVKALKPLFKESLKYSVELVTVLSLHLKV